MSHIEKNIPIVTDLDGSLLNIDSTALSMIQMLKNYPSNYLKAILWLPKGKYFFKSHIEKYSNIIANQLPYNEVVLKFLKDEKSKGREIYLATASMQSIADKINNHLQIFKGAYGSENNINLSSSNKLNKLEELFGKYNFDYIGDSNSDLIIWENANKGYAIKPDKSLSKQIAKNYKINVFIEKKSSNIKLLIKQLNILKWTINLLLFLPLAVLNINKNDEIIENLILSFFAISLIDSFLGMKKVLFSIADYEFDNYDSKDILSGELKIFILLRFMLIILILSLILMFLLSSNIPILLLFLYFILGEYFIHSKHKISNSIEIFKIVFKIFIGYYLIK